MIDCYKIKNGSQKKTFKFRKIPNISTLFVFLNGVYQTIGLDYRFSRNQRYIKMLDKRSLGPGILTMHYTPLSGLENETVKDSPARLKLEDFRLTY